jgi:hypothetical protein
MVDDDALPPDLSHPLDAFVHREPVQGAGVAVVVVVPAGDDPAQAPSAGEAIAAQLRGRQRVAMVLTPDLTPGRGQAIHRIGRGAEAPVVLVARTTSPLPESVLKALLDAIDRADHVWTRRPVAGGWGGRLARWLRNLPARVVLALPVADPHAPFSVHRREKLAAIPLQSRSDFVDIELAAKATFLGHLIDQVDMPDIARPAPRADVRDRLAVLKHPTFRVEPDPPPPSAPLEDPKGDEERHDGPGRQDEQARPDLGQPGTLEHDAPQAADGLRQG